ncbi:MULTISPECIES: restriction endonuclease subunit S [Campylobacter]|uniref:restriction endonuclease subunit S n=1 Tax=Campylobacter TaxID=194 RepID=UPI000A33D7B7|nr:restriction endonuclease subunit S [Campylobacter sp. P0124]MCR8696171.1 restriction endonuclease subunit S [Campylobacter sp. RM19073]
MNTNFKDSGIAWIGQIPKHWEVKKIKYCLKENFSGCWGDDLENEQISHNSRLCIRVADFDFDKQKIKQTADTFRNYTKSQILSTKLQDGDLIIEKSGGGDKMPVGRSVVFEQNLFGAKEVLFANFCQCFRPLNINNKFFAHTMKAFYQNNNMRFFFNQTTGIQNLSIFNIVNAFLPYPPLNEQKKIAEFLDKKCEIIDKRLENLEQKIKSLKEYKKSLISECVTKGINSKNMEFKDSGIPWIGQIPKHWEISKIKYVAKIRNENFSFNAENDKYIGLENVAGYLNSLIETNTEYENSIQAVCKKGDILFGKLRPYLSKVIIAPFNCFCSSEFLQFINLKCYFKFFYYFLLNKNFIENVNSSTYGAKMPRANSNYIMNLNFLLPPLNEQKEIAEFLDKKCEKIDRLNENYTKQITALKEYKKSLIYECVTGKKEI